jgi:hypothetical protein
MNIQELLQDRIRIKLGEDGDCDFYTIIPRHYNKKQAIHTLRILGIIQ